MDGVRKILKWRQFEIGQLVRYCVFALLLFPVIFRTNNNTIRYDID